MGRKSVNIRVSFKIFEMYDKTLDFIFEHETVKNSITGTLPINALT